MVFDCSFAEYGDYSEMGNAWDSMQINSISVIPESTADTSVENVYSVDTANMSDVRLCNYSYNNMKHGHYLYQYRSCILLLWSIFKRGKLMKHLRMRSCSSTETLSISATLNTSLSQSRSLFQVNNLLFCTLKLLILNF